MYKIVGVDGQQYGPVSAKEIRRWIAENHDNAQTLVQAESVPEWKPLARFRNFPPNGNRRRRPSPRRRPPWPRKRPTESQQAFVILLAVLAFINSFSGTAAPETSCWPSHWQPFRRNPDLWLAVPAMGVMRLIGLIKGLFTCASPTRSLCAFIWTPRKGCFNQVKGRRRNRIARNTWREPLPSPFRNSP